MEKGQKAGFLCQVRLKIPLTKKRKGKIARARREKGGKEKKAVVDTLKM